MKKRIAIAVMAVFVCLTMGGASAPEITVTGTVTDATDSLPLVGVSIVVKGANRGTVSDGDGKYSISVQKGKVLVFSYIGFDSQEVTVRQTTHNVEMKPSQEALDEVLVVAFGTEKKERIFYPNYPNMVAAPQSIYFDAMDNEDYGSAVENRFKTATDDPLSTFSIDVDAASYSNMRRFINQGQLPPKDAIRTEELVNYFSYDYKPPEGNDPVSITAETGECPWNALHRLVRIGIKAREIPSDQLPASNFVFLIDVSGSMFGPTRLELVKSSLKMLVNNLREKDRVAIVVYAGAAGEALPSTPGNDRQKIREALDRLSAGGSTAGGAGIQLAYKIARKNFIPNGNNRIILCTDGDFNVGVSSNAELENLIEKERESGVFLTILGYGMGNYKDSKMQTLAEKGNGNHAYIDNMQESNRVLVQQFGATMYAVAKDVKLQIEFNPAKVQAYRLIGYESRLLNKEDFNDDTKDAGEIGAGHSVTAFYEIVPVGVEGNFPGKVDDLKYQSKTGSKPVANASPDLLTVKLRYKLPDENTSRKMEMPVIDKGDNKVSEDFRFASAVAMFGQLLRNSDFKGTATCDKVIALAGENLGNDPKGYRREFLRLVETTKGLQ
ncbi:MAG: von Willebrand factor type A domain-containing protein [Bacteroidales bacterium]|nr:von Willebrand factor type A domain-containing protein [Bacteroidales bacterium]